MSTINMFSNGLSVSSPKRVVKGLGRTALAVAFVVLAVPDTALADSYSPCVAKESDVKVGTTSKNQQITCVIKPVCGESWGQLYYVTWDMAVHSGGITVKSIRLNVIHTQGELITVGRKWIQGRNTQLSLGAYNNVPERQTSWTKVYNPRDKYFSKNSAGFVNLWISVSSLKANGCAAGWNTIRFSLKPVA